MVLVLKRIERRAERVRERLRKMEGAERESDSERETE